MLEPGIREGKCIRETLSKSGKAIKNEILFITLRRAKKITFRRKTQVVIELDLRIFEKMVSRRKECWFVWR